MNHWNKKRFKIYLKFCVFFIYILIAVVDTVHKLYSDVREKFKRNPRAFAPFPVSTALNFFCEKNLLTRHILMQRNNIAEYYFTIR